MTRAFDVAILGAGFSGSILARILALEGLRVALFERHRHPRFALGESSTPLAGLALERLAQRYALDDLAALASWGRWQSQHSRIGCGLKRGFTFYRHRPGSSFLSDDDRRLVAASPDDEIADCHWLRSELDSYLVKQAIAAGVEYRDETEVVDVELRDSFVRVGWSAGADEGVLDAEFLVDATGSGSLLRSVGVFENRPKLGAGGMICAHLEGVQPVAKSKESRQSFVEGPYPDERAAVHHLIDEGWIYSLRFDDGRTSVGLELSEFASQQFEGVDARKCWQTVTGRYPALERCFREAHRVAPAEWRWTPPAARRLEAVAGHRWLALPHTAAFFGPLFSTGIAWSLLGVERSAKIILSEGLNRERLQSRYSELLSRESDHLENLHRAAWACMEDFDRFSQLTHLYFAAASWCEIRQRLLECDEELGWAWEGFLGAKDPHFATVFSAAVSLSREMSAVDWRHWVAEQIRDHNLIGLDDRRRIGVDLETLRNQIGLIGLSGAEFDSLAPRLRGL